MSLNENPISKAPISAKDIDSLKKELETILQELDPYKTELEEDFDTAVVSLGLYMLLEGKPDKSWQDTILKNPRVLQKFPTLRDTYRLCQVEKCPYYEQCPIMRQLSEAQQEKLRETQCRADRIYTLEMLVGLINELDIKPDAVNDIIIVSDMVHYLIRKRQIKWEINKESELTISTPHLVVQSTGNVHNRKEAHPLFAYEILVDKQLESLRKQLIATRRERALLNPQNKTKDALSALMERLRQQQKEALPSEATPVTYTVKEKEE